MFHWIDIHEYTQMANSRVHFPDDLLRKLDHEAKRQGLSRNRLIVAACEKAISAPVWPDRFFDPLPEAELKLLDDPLEFVDSPRTSTKPEPEL